MVSVAQLVERWIVAPVVVGSSPITHLLSPRYAMVQFASNKAETASDLGGNPGAAHKF